MRSIGRWAIWSLAALARGRPGGTWRPSQRAARPCASPMSAGPTSPRRRPCASRILEALGYEPTTEVLAVPVTYASMKNKDIDVFLGNWMPTMEADRKPYVDDKSVEVARRQSRRRQIHARGADLHSTTQGSSPSRTSPSSRTSSSGKIYGIEPGNDGNRLILDMIEDDKFGLEGFELVESSEQGMLAQVERATRAQGADRVPRLGAAPDEHQLRDELSRGRRRGLRPELWRRHRLHQCPRRLSRRNARMSARSSRTSSSRCRWRTS